MENQFRTSERIGMEERYAVWLMLSISSRSSIASSLIRIARIGISVREEIKIPSAMQTRPNRKNPIYVQIRLDQMTRP